MSNNTIGNFVSTCASTSYNFVTTQLSKIGNLMGRVFSILPGSDKIASIFSAAFKTVTQPASLNEKIVATVFYGAAVAGVATLAKQFFCHELTKEEAEKNVETATTALDEAKKEESDAQAATLAAKADLERTAKELETAEAKLKEAKEADKEVAQSAFDAAKVNHEAAVEADAKATKSEEAAKTKVATAEKTLADAQEALKKFDVVAA